MQNHRVMRNNGTLPKALVEKFGEDAVRKVIGLGPLSDKVVSRRETKWKR